VKIRPTDRLGIRRSSHCVLCEFAAPIGRSVSAARSAEFTAWRSCSCIITTA